MGDVAELSYQNANRFTQETINIFLQFLKYVADVIDDNTQYAPYRRMAQYIKNNQPVHFYQVQGGETKPTEKLLRRLDEQRIPYLRLLDKDTLIIQETDILKVQEANRQILLETSRYFQDVPMEEMLEMAHNRNESVTCFYGLSNYEVETFKNKCNNIDHGFTVGIERLSNNTFNMAVPNNWVFEPSIEPYQYDVCKAYLASMFSLYGNEDVKKKEIDYNEKVDNTIWQNIKEGKTFFVIGKENKFIEINPNGLEVYKVATDKDGKSIQLQEKKVSLKDINFAAELELQLDKMHNKAICYTFENVAQELTKKAEERKGEDNTSYDRRGEKVVAKMEAAKNMRNQVDSIVRQRLTAASRSGSFSAQSLFNLYAMETKKLLEANVHNEVPEGYTQEDMDAIRDANVGIYQKFGKIREKESLGSPELHKIIAHMDMYRVKERKGEELTAPALEQLRKERDHGFYNVQRQNDEPTDDR